ncbi:hypothetical protein [Parapedobacter koreensis]|uniref:DUF4374 domain-containing protein n=1 Tax=Parapedobacter koreensis TaxID=332977 RepID=A0A1H7EWY5_9SPHI|nr:hypothetical protein [Parapedobacter koreensis]SEK18371.1 hypothetical protein SAMN05421740_10191 [Parapedobacter koreensis]
MKKQFLFAVIPTALLAFAACSDDDPTPPENATAQYLVQTMSAIEQVKPGFTAAYSEFPSGTISNVSQPNALQGSANEGWRTYNGMVFKMFNASFERGIYKLNVTADGRISYDPSSIKTNNTINGSGNFVIESDTRGYYWDADAPWIIQTFNPTTMQRTGQLDDDFESALKRDDEGINFQGIGQHFLAIKQGKLYADIVYSKGSGGQSGMFNDFFEDVYIAVIDLNTGTYEKTITVENTGGIAYINDNEMFSFDSNGDLYIVFQGRTALGGLSKIARIKANETDIDASWELKFSDYNASDAGKFTGVFAKNGKLILTVNQEPLVGGPTGNINAGEIWKFYTVDIASKAFTAVEGVELSTNAGGSYAAFELDGKTILRVNAPSKGISGFYELNGNTATQLFRVAEGHAAGFTKINVNN